MKTPESSTPTPLAPELDANFTNLVLPAPAGETNSFRAYIAENFAEEVRLHGEIESAAVKDAVDAHTEAVSPLWHGKIINPGDSFEEARELQDKA